MKIYAGVITISDRGYRGERADKSGPEIISMLEGMGITILHSKVIPDDKE